MVLNLRLEHGEIASHERVALLLDVEEVLCGEVRHLAPVLTLPATLLPNIFWDELVEPAVAADHEHVVVGDGAEGLVAHTGSLQSCEALMPICAPTRTVVAPRVSQTLAESVARSAFASLPLQQLRIARANGTAGERVHARGL